MLTKEQFLLKLVKDWWDCASSGDVWECIHCDKDIHDTFVKLYGKEQEEQVQKDIEVLFKKLRETYYLRAAIDGAVRDLNVCDG
jgi:hypothetical protein